MKAPVLVAFATRYGSTQEVAQALAAAIHGEGLDAEVRQLREVQSVDKYGGVVIGAPLQMGRWHKDALRFVDRHRDGLSSLAVAVFALGPTTDAEKDWSMARAQLDKELARFPWLRPFSVKVFGGRFDPALLRFPFTLLPGMKKLPASDVRDWAAIGEWGRELSAQIVVHTQDLWQP
ncbi:MAG: flavodoxin domain-containing protein [Thermoleophilia bacterium]|nr:flavodoxin domain-containing protein [Thermoleophilia bacterium]